MIIVPKLKLAFMHVPKTGGSSITAALLPYLPNHSDVEVGVVGWQCKFHKEYMHTPFNQLRWYKPDDEWRTFAVVRDPFDRMHSYYVDTGEKTGMTFLEWLKKAPGNNRFQVAPQYSLISRDGQVAMDVVIPYENLTEGLATLGIQLPEKRELDYGRTREQMLAAYEAEPEAVDVVRSMAGRDFEEFRYSPHLFSTEAVGTHPYGQ